MQVLLKKDVSNLGQSGDIKNVKNGYARNYLIPNDLVIIASVKTRKERLLLKEVQKRKIIKRKGEAEQKSLELKNLSIELEAKSGLNGKLYGSITNIDIHKALVNDGLLIDRRMIILDNPIKALGVFKVPIKLYQGVQVEIQVTVTNKHEDVSTEKEVTEKVIEEASSSNKDEVKNSDDPSASLPSEEKTSSTSVKPKEMEDSTTESSNSSLNQ